MSSILFTDADGTWKLHNAKPWPASRLSGWTPDSLPFGERAHRQSDGAMTMLRLRDDFGVTFDLPLIPSHRSWNAWTFSEELDNAAYTKTRSSVTANQTIAPDGSLTADKIIEDGTASNSHRIDRNLTGATDNTKSSFSMFAKAGTRTWCAITMVRKDGTSVTAYFDLATGVYGTVSAGLTTLASSYWGNGWHRIGSTVDVLGGGTTPAVRVSLATGDLGATYSGDGASYIYAWGLQPEADRTTPSPSYLYTLSSARAGVSLAEIADRLKYHLLNGGTCTVYTNDAAASSYATCGLKPGTTPQLTLSDRRTLEYTLSLQLINLAGSPARFLAAYAEQ